MVLGFCFAWAVLQVMEISLEMQTLWEKQGCQ